MSIAVSRLDLLRHVSDHRSTICSNHRCKSNRMITEVPNIVTFFDNNVRILPSKFSILLNEFFRSIMRHSFCFPNTLLFFCQTINENPSGAKWERPLRSYDGEITLDDSDCCRVRSTFLTILLLFWNVYGVSFERVTRRIYIDASLISKLRDKYW